MADPRFYDNRGPFKLAALCAAAGIDAGGVVTDRGDSIVADLANLEDAGADHLSFFTGLREMAPAFARSHAGFCLVPKGRIETAPPGMVLLPASDPLRAFAAMAMMFYPAASHPVWSQGAPVSRFAQMGNDVALGPGAVIGDGAQIGDSIKIGANSTIGPGVTIGRGSVIGNNVSISHAHLGDGVVILSGARIGQSGFGFVSSAAGHLKIPQLGRVIIQDRVEIGASTAIDRGALSDTVIGEGTKIDNLVQVGHNVQMGRHCVVAAQTGIAGSCRIGDFVVMGGQVGLGDHTIVGAGARLGARCATVSGQVLDSGRDYGGVPAKPIREWARELYALSRLAKRR